MDYFFKNLEAAQVQARHAAGLAAASAQMSAKGLAAQVSGQTRALVDQASSLAGHVTENTRALAGSLPQAKALQEHATAVSGHTRALAERASSLSTAAAEQASSRMQGLGLSDGLGERLHLLARPGTGEAPSAAELEEFGITPDFCDFVRSLTYSTFRDFPDAAGQTDSDSEAGERSAASAPPLTAWQAQHAMLVVRHVKEVNELRYVLCPKRLRDAQFWAIYFTLARRYLPAEAYDPAYQPKSSGPRAAVDWQARLAGLSTSARQWGAGVSAPLRSIATGAASSLQPPSTAAAATQSTHAAVSSQTPTGSGSAPATELGADPEFEACLQDALSHHNTGQPGSLKPATDSSAVSLSQRSTAGSQADGDDDFEQYLNELDQDEGDESRRPGAIDNADEGSGEELDLEELMKDFQEDDATGAIAKKH